MGLVEPGTTPRDIVWTVDCHRTGTRMTERPQLAPPDRSWAAKAAAAGSSPRGRSPLLPEAILEPAFWISSQIERSVRDRARQNGAERRAIWRGAVLRAVVLAPRATPPPPPGRLSTSGAGSTYGRSQSKRGMW